MLDAANISFHTPVTMRNDIRDQRRVFGWALPTSIALHLLIVALLLFGLPATLSQPGKEQPIAVDIVPPPKPPEKTKPPSPAEPPKPEKQPEAKVETPASREVAAQRPVFQFGETDAGPRKSLDGNSAEDGSEQPPAPQVPSNQDLAQPPADTAVEGKDQAPSPGASPPPKPKPADVAKVQRPLKLQEAKRLFSKSATGDPVATTAMAALPRGERVGQLCATELGGQLLHASPPYFFDSIPKYRLKAGTVMNVASAPFPANGQWYDLSFRCEVDPNATRVVSFAFRVGNPVPRSEWKRRGLPAE
ncbi:MULTISPECIES: DUF930 domain-containing protein [unclassified Mesorhizobium]|uniref:DUF930 domain-containing protein n=1 Tax=unclassified Mesorhizobium TaxID=325217 RepID=UPI0033386524